MEVFARLVRSCNHDVTYNTDKDGLTATTKARLVANKGLKVIYYLQTCALTPKCKASTEPCV